MHKERTIILVAGIVFLSTGLLGCRDRDLNALDYNAYDYPHLMNAGALERKRRQMVEELCLEKNRENGAERFVLKTVSSDLTQLCQNALKRGSLG